VAAATHILVILVESATLILVILVVVRGARHPASGTCGVTS